MNKYNESRFSMANDVIKLFNTNPGIWEADTIITAILDKARKGIADVNETLKRQSVKTQGYTEAKSKYRTKLNNDLDYILSAIRTYAKQTDNDVLHKEANLTPTAIRRMKDTIIIPIFEKFLDYATEHAKDLEPYGIREAGLKTALADLDGYKDFLSMPRDIKSQRAAATEKLKKQMNELINVFDEEMDDAMVKYRRSNPDFYNDYLKTRIIFDNPTHHKSMHGTVTDEETKQPLEHVKVIFQHDTDVLNPDSKFPTTYTTENGYYEFKSLPDGPGTVIFELPFYDTLHMEVNLLPNKDRQLDVALRKTE